MIMLRITACTVINGNFGIKKTGLMGYINPLCASNVVFRIRKRIDIFIGSSFTWIFLLTSCKIISIRALLYVMFNWRLNIGSMWYY